MPLSEFFALNASFIAAAGFCSMAHKNVTPKQYLKTTFTPRSWREFLNPPCPFCWAARAFLAGSFIAVVA